MSTAIESPRPEGRTAGSAGGPPAGSRQRPRADRSRGPIGGSRRRRRRSGAPRRRPVLPAGRRGRRPLAWRLTDRGIAVVLVVGLMITWPLR